MGYRQKMSCEKRGKNTSIIIVYAQVSEPKEPFCCCQQLFDNIAIVVALSR